MPRRSERKKSTETLSSAATLRRISKNTLDILNVTDSDILNLENIQRSQDTYSAVSTSQEKVLNEIPNSKDLRDCELLNEISRNDESTQDGEERILFQSEVSDKRFTNKEFERTKVRMIVSEIVGTEVVNATCDSNQIVFNQINKNDDKSLEYVEISKDTNVAIMLNSSLDEAYKIPFINSDISKNRKRRWTSNKITEILSPIFSISTDSLKNVISDVHPVPLSDIDLDSSSEVEEVCTEWQHSVESCPKNVFKGFTGVEIQLLEKENFFIPRKIQNLTEDINCSILRSPSPSRNKESNILYITNLVRPFTVLQLKGLLARTGKIMDDGFWIDRIKSKCFVQYETEDEAIETRHALHGIRWPTSNPKCLNVDFGKKEDMQRAIIMTKKNTDDINFLSKHDRKAIPVREWDVGKNNCSDDIKKPSINNCKKERDFVKSYECERNDIKPNYRKESSVSSISPVRRQKVRENDPPLRLLDDLFRKTQTTPCIYWLPLTPEQIAEKENIRKKRIVEQQRRMHKKKIDRIKSYEGENELFKEKNQEFEKEHGFHRSVERRMSRSKDKRWN